MYSKQLYPHHGSILVRLLVRPKTAQGFVSGEIVDRDSSIFIIEADSEEECKQQTRELMGELKEAYSKWLAKKSLSVPVVEQA
jgi:hypothetical protein